MKANTFLKATALFIVGLGFVPNGHSQANTISFDTSTADGWTVSAEGINGATPYIVNASVVNGSGSSENCLSVTSDGVSDGSFLPGGECCEF